MRSMLMHQFLTYKFAFLSPYTGLLRECGRKTQIDVL